MKGDIQSLSLSIILSIISDNCCIVSYCLHMTFILTYSLSLSLSISPGYEWLKMVMKYHSIRKIHAYITKLLS